MKKAEQEKFDRAWDNMTKFVDTWGRPVRVIEENRDVVLTRMCVAKIFAQRGYHWEPDDGERMDWGEVMNDVAERVTHMTEKQILDVYDEFIRLYA